MVTAMDDRFEVHVTATTRTQAIDEGTTRAQLWFGCPRQDLLLWSLAASEVKDLGGRFLHYEVDMTFERVEDAP